MWSRNGRELFYLVPGGGGVNVVDYKVQGDTFVAGQPRAWLQKPNTGFTGGVDLAPDGKRFVVAMDADAGEQKPSTHAVFLFNFFDELRRRVSPSVKLPDSTSSRAGGLGQYLHEGLHCVDLAAPDFEGFEQNQRVPGTVGARRRSSSTAGPSLLLRHVDDTGLRSGYLMMSAS
jgi:hypothetical protein